MTNKTSQKASKIILLCEDKAHELFVRRFLRTGWGVKTRLIRTLAYPDGEGSGKNFVHENLKVESNAIRKRQAASILIVVRDADDQSVEKVRTVLDNIIDEKMGRGDRERIVYVIPKYHIETWIAYLYGEKEIDESEAKFYKSRFQKLSESKDSHPCIDNLAKTCKYNRELISPPNSLVDACKEFTRIRNSL